MSTTLSNRRFSLGKVVITCGAIKAVSPEDSWEAIHRHASGDWGDLCDDDRQQNDEALECQARLLSRYFTRSGVCFWIITEWDRSVTTILLPEEF